LRSVLARALRLGVQVALVIGVQYPLCAGLIAFCIHLPSLAFTDPPFFFFFSATSANFL